MLKALLKKSKKNQKGFTLIELLAVIVILAILAAIAIPSVMNIIAKQHDKAAVQDAITAIHAAKLYTGDHNVTGDQTFSASLLNQYIDKSVQSSLPSDYSVTYTSTSESYSITDSKLASLKNNPFSDGTATEQALINYDGSSSSTATSSN